MANTTSRTRKAGSVAACFTLYDAFGVENLSVNLARDAAVAHGIHPTTAQIQFYKWRAARTAK